MATIKLNSILSNGLDEEERKTIKLCYINFILNDVYRVSSPEL